jgi:hypothetical protein
MMARTARLPNGHWNDCAGPKKCFAALLIIAGACRTSNVHCNNRFLHLPQLVMSWFSMYTDLNLTEQQGR